ncbi:hypothetical protein CRYUN_Cryun02cG0123800 [Craigia yunnanensis]
MDLMELSHLVNLLRRHKDGSSSCVVINVIRRVIDAVIRYKIVGVIGGDHKASTEAICDAFWIEFGN